ncbi:Crp/Fnr family transcriptional regulator [Flavobacterium lutivivi]|nr:MAG: transcriptional activator FtrB [archaeon ADurb.Bin336]GGC79425.1 Crp/Fnr family transcriptional regulator [Flavobacterium lutivivi]
MSLSTQIKQQFPHFKSELISEIITHGIEKTIPKDTELLRVGQHVKVIPLVLKGVIKVFTRHEDKELLLYYIKPNESCIMSFSAGINQLPSIIYAVTEEESHLLLIPADKLRFWTTQFPDFNSLFFYQYNLRYTDLLETINSLLFDKLDKRVFQYLKDKANVTNSNPIKISHRQIASELGTAREVISRIIKKMEADGKLKQNTTTIEILDL